MGQRLRPLHRWVRLARRSLYRIKRHLVLEAFRFLRVAIRFQNRVAPKVLAEEAFLQKIRMHHRGMFPTIRRTSLWDRESKR